MTQVTRASFYRDSAVLNQGTGISRCSCERLQFAAIISDSNMQYLHRNNLVHPLSSHAEVFHIPDIGLELACD